MNSIPSLQPLFLCPWSVVEVPPIPPVMEFPDMQPTSDDELQLMEDAELLHSQLRTVGDPVDATFAKLFVRSLEDKLLGMRVRKWQHRKIHLEKSLRIANSRADANHSQTPAPEHPRLLSASGHGNSGAAADSADRARVQRPIPQTEHCAADSAPPPKFRSSGRFRRQSKSAAADSADRALCCRFRTSPKIPEQRPIPQLPQKTLPR